MSTSAAASARIVPPAAGDRLVVLGAPVTIKSDGAAERMLFADHEVPPGYGVPLHVHYSEDELCYVLEGEITFMTPEGSHVAGPGTFVDLPRGCIHGFRNDAGRPARMLVVCSPEGDLDGVFRDLDRAGHAPEPLTPAAVGEITSRHDVWLV